MTLRRGYGRCVCAYDAADVEVASFTCCCCCCYRYDVIKPHWNITASDAHVSGKLPGGLQGCFTPKFRGRWVSHTATKCSVYPGISRVFCSVWMGYKCRKTLFLSSHIQRHNGNKSIYKMRQTAREKKNSSKFNFIVKKGKSDVTSDSLNLELVHRPTGRTIGMQLWPLDISACLTKFIRRNNPRWLHNTDPKAPHHNSVKSQRWRNRWDKRRTERTMTGWNERGRPCSGRRGHQSVNTDCEGTMLHPTQGTSWQRETSCQAHAHTHTHSPIAFGC